MTNESEKPAFLSKIEAYHQELGARRSLLREQAQNKGLMLYPSSSSKVWVEANQIGQVVPEKFYVEDYLSTAREPKLDEYHFKLPISSVDELVDSLKALDAFYYGISTMQEHARMGLYGLIEFLEERSQTTLRSYSSDQVNEFIQSDQLDEDAKRIADQFEQKTDKEK